MAEGRVKRRLAAVLAADVVGYSRLMEQDEAGTLATLKARRRAVVEPLVARHDGRIFKVTGDGLFAEFSSPVAAVDCAIEIQRDMVAANRDQAQGCPIVLRIGVNLGDVMVEGGDLYGDGVNIAARLEGLAEPGGILVSGTTYDHARNKVRCWFEDIGLQTVKNMAEPVRVYRVADSSVERAKAAAKASDKPSIAVLPFVNMSGDPEQQYFSDGITEDIITELSRFRSLFVIARNSSFHYKGQSPKVQDVGRDLGVRYVVEGSVRKAGNRVRVIAQLVDAVSGNHLWAERYDRDMGDLFAVQDEVTQAIASTIEGRMAASGAQHSRRKPTDDLVAYDYFLQAREKIDQRDDKDATEQLLRRAIELDPEFAQAHAWLARFYIYLWHTNLRSETLQEALDLAQMAVSLDQADAWCHAVVGMAYLFGSQHDLAGLHLDKAISLNPTDSRITSMRGLWLTFMGRSDEAVQSLDLAMRRDPFTPAYYWAFYSVAQFQARRYQESIQAINHLSKLERWDFFYLAASYAHLDQMEAARAWVAALQQRFPDITLRQVRLTEPYKDPADVEHLLEGLRKAGVPEG